MAKSVEIQLSDINQEGTETAWNRICELQDSSEKKKLRGISTNKI